MDQSHGQRDTPTNQLTALQQLGVFSAALPAAPKRKRLVNPYDENASLESRARSYLHVNCSGCHTEAGGGNAAMNLLYTLSDNETKLFYERPRHDTFGIDNAMLVAPGDAERSVLVHRLSHRGSGQMPPLVSQVVDTRAVSLFRAWINQMQSKRPFVRDWKMEDFAVDIRQPTAQHSLDKGEKALESAGCFHCHRFRNRGGGIGPDLTAVGTRLNARQILESIVEPSNVIAEQFANVEIETTSGRVHVGRVEQETDEHVIMRTVAKPNAPTVIQKDAIDERRLSRISNMPTGTVNSLTHAEIVDLVRYLIANGRPDHPGFQYDK